MKDVSFYDAHKKCMSVILSAEPENIEGAVRYWNLFVRMFKYRLVKVYPDYYLGGIAKYEYHEAYNSGLVAITEKVRSCSLSIRFNLGKTKIETIRQ